MTSLVLGSVSAFAAVSALAMLAVLVRLRALLFRHETALAAMRADLGFLELIRQGQGDADHLFIRHRAGTDTTWVDIVLTAPGISLRMPIRPDQMDGIIANLRGTGYPDEPAASALG